LYLEVGGRLPIRMPGDKWGATDPLFDNDDDDDDGARAGELRNPRFSDSLAMLWLTFSAPEEAASARGLGEAAKFLAATGASGVDVAEECRFRWLELDTA
jgi:hypothetical protein